MNKLRVMLADDHGVLRAGLASLLDAQPDLMVVGEAAEAEDAVRLASELDPDVVLMDVRMPGNGIDATRRIKADHPQLRILILSQYDDPVYLRQAMAAGASGYALKRGGGQELLQAIRAVGRGEVYLHPSMAKVLVEESWGPRQPAPPGPQEPLTERETQVLRLIAHGYTTAEIAAELYLSVRTVEAHKTRLMEKLGVRGRRALVQFARRQGLLAEE
jgi:DNA-binding NarL/FixJ family response regulator